MTFYSSGKPKTCVLARQALIHVQGYALRIGAVRSYGNGSDEYLEIYDTMRVSFFPSGKMKALTFDIAKNASIGPWKTDGGNFERAQDVRDYHQLGDVQWNLDEMGTVLCQNDHA